MSDASDGPTAAPAVQSPRRLIPLLLLAAALVVLLWLAKLAISVLLMGFAAVLLGVLIESLAHPIKRFTRVTHTWAIMIVLLLLCGVGVGLGALVVPSFAREVDELVTTLPQQTTRIEARLLEYRWGRMLLNRASGHDAQENTQRVVADASGDVVATTTTAPTTQEGERLTKTVQAAAQPIMDGAGLFAAGLVNALVGVLIVLAAGIYLAIDPRTYQQGVLHLIPKQRRPLVGQTFAALHHTLRWWLIGQGITMLAIGLLTGVGLWLIGVRLWLTFAILAALFNFVPNFGPLVSFVPAILFALADPEAGSKVFWITILYLVAQTFEGYILTPLVQKKAVDMPPALLILFQVLAGLLMGALGLMLAAPLLAATMVAIKMLYVRPVLHDPIEVEGLPAR